MAVAYKSGTDGRVRSGSTVLAGATSWNVNETAGAVVTTNFESTANADGIVYAEKRVGIGEWTVDVEVVINVDASTGLEVGTDGIRNGKTVDLDLYVDKTNAKGYAACTGFVSNFKRGVQINNTAYTGSFTVTGTGPFPAYGTIS